MPCEKQYIDYMSYYLDQANNSNQIRHPHQRGSGRVFQYSKRVAVPAAKYLVKQAIEGIKDLQSVSPAKSKVKTVLRKRGAAVLRDIADKVEQSGSGLRKKPKLTIKAHNKRKTSSKRKTDSK